MFAFNFLLLNYLNLISYYALNLYFQQDFWGSFPQISHITADFDIVCEDLRNLREPDNPITTENPG